MAVAEKGCLLSAPDTYMEKIAIGPGYPNNIIDLDNTVEKNIKLIARQKELRLKILQPVYSKEVDMIKLYHL